jgi:hypothetical protein
MACGAIIPVLKEALRLVTLSPSALKIWVFVSKLTEELVLGLDVLRTYNVSCR